MMVIMLALCCVKCILSCYNDDDYVGLLLHEMLEVLNRCNEEQVFSNEKWGLYSNVFA